MSFASLGLSEALLRAVNEQGYTTPTPIQLQAIPAVLRGGDLLAGAQTGTGKTAGFVLPLLQRLSTTPRASAGRGQRRSPRALILTPTRELALQVEASVRAYGKYAKHDSMAIFGGVGFGPQLAQLRRGVDIVVATPGRLLDHHGQGSIDFSSIEVLVLDEADRMLDMGFIHDIRRILALLPKRRQNLLFSATFSDDIRSLANGLLDRPATIEVTPRNSTVDAVAQRVHPVDRDRKRELLAYLVGRNDWRQVLVFTRTKHGANKLAEQLVRDGISTEAIHGNKSQGARTRALAQFKDGRVRVLVAPDIAARGIDIEDLPHVVNYDLPNVPEDYVHRIGRTGRAGASGEALSLVCVDEHAFLRDIERLIRRTLPREVVPGFEPDPNARAQPVFAQRGQRPAQPRQGAASAHAAPRRAAQGDRGKEPSQPQRAAQGHRGKGPSHPARAHHAAGPHGHVDRRGGDRGAHRTASRTR
jgi:ATP-dependent RNA helicase RhlE